MVPWFLPSFDTRWKDLTVFAIVVGPVWKPTGKKLLSLWSGQNQISSDIWRGHPGLRRVKQANGLVHENVLCLVTKRTQHLHRCQLK